MKTIREKFMEIKTIVAALPILFLTGCTQNSSSIGIIGGADGPTTVFVTGKFNWGHILAAIGVVIALVVAIVLLVKKFIKKN